MPMLYALGQHGCHHARIHLHHGKTQVWNRGRAEWCGGHDPSCSSNETWRSGAAWEPMLPATQEGLKVLGIPIGHERFVQRFLENKTTEQQVFFQQIEWVNDLQSPYLQLLMCSSTRANFWLRALRRRRGFCQTPRRERVDMLSSNSWDAE